MAEGFNRFLGDTPLRVAIKLIVVSLLVGFAMHTFGVYPTDILFWAQDFIGDLWRTGFRALGRVGDYLLIGAVVVIPVFILIRILSWRKS
ncbi:hypothetical protein M2360_001055 [Rhizobium sp. SG_E_25_P2]|uniref:DUF6460 domain-containing protein n=1 Tax=Rhizobium sp. SG_E_25_P2 TaxID=2879942 RepID=UPI002476695A|nr:DUF6460 domain-containing protein [Rhizobium sp. SG_E_25_P2]MDH6265665.1 hypothetical protein [Rhizobium sp. SG_E_25_P2]